MKDFLNILLIEDNPGDARIMGELLKEVKLFEYEFVHKTTLREGMELIQQKDFNLVLLDMSLPDSFGQRTFNSIHNKYPDIPIILVSGTEDEELSLKLISLGAQDYINKSGITTTVIERSISYSLERNKLRISLRESEELFRTILYSTVDAIITTDIDGKVRYMNPMAEELTGWKEDEADGKPVREVFSIFNENTREEVENPVEKVLEKGKPVLLSNHTFLKAKNGIEIPVGNSAAPIRNAKGEISGVVLAFRDQIKERLAKKTIEESELHFHSLANFSPVGIFRTRPDGYTTYVNPKWCQLSGLSAEKALGDGWLSAVHPEDREKLADERKLASRSESVSVSEYRFLQPNGNIVYLLGQAVAEINSENQITGYIGTITDITERKQAEESLKLAEFKLQTFADFTFDWEYWEDENNKLVYISPSCQRITGYTSEEFISKPGLLDSIIYPDDVDSVHKHDEKTHSFKNMNERNELEFRIIKKDGSVSIIYHTCSPIFDENKKFLGHRGSNSDITERKRAEKELIKSEEKFRKFFDKHAAIKIIVDPETGNIVEANKAASVFYGWTNEELTAMNVIQINTLAPEEVEREVKKAHSNKQNFFEYRHRLKDGSIKEVAVFNSAIEIDGKEYLHSIVQDITSSKQAEKQLKLLGLAVERNPASIVITNAEGIIEYVNPQFTEITGYTAVEVSGKYPNILKSGYQSSEFYRNLWETISSGQIWSGEILNKRKNGELYWENVFISPVENELGKISHYVGVKEDITVRKQLFDELIVAKEHAQESDRLKSAFLATMSHELRTPLNAVIGFSSLIDEEMPMDQITSFAQMIHNSGNNLLEIVEGILDLTMLESGESKTHPELFSLSSFMDDVLKIAIDEQQKANKPQLEIEYLRCNTDGPSHLYSDRQKITKVFVHLFRNALKFTSTGQIEFGYVVVNKGESNSIQFFVKDTGIGIQGDQKSLIFERFRQVEDSFTRKYGGTGIGLTISKQIVELLGGQIRVDSETGKGSTFYFTIPYYAEPDEIIVVEDVNLNGKTEIQIKGIKILIAEDDESSSQFITLIARKFGKEIINVCNGAKAVEACRNHVDIDLVLMDIQMPEMDGYEATRQIRKFNSKVVIIAQTAFALSGDKEKAIEAGCNDYLSKPIKKDQLMDLMEKYFN